MKKSIVGLVLITLLLWTCQDAAEKGLKETSLSENFNETVGERIPVEVAERWLENYNKSHNQRTKDNSIIYGVSPAQLNMILKSNPVGIVLHHALDEAGIHHIIVIPIDRTMRLWSSSTRTLLVDSKMNKTINQDLAQTWIKNYQNTNPNSVRSHFFGVNIFTEIAGNPKFSNLEIKQATNDKGMPQLLLLAWSNTGSSSGKLTAEEPSVYDASGPCPGWCLPQN